MFVWKSHSHPFLPTDLRADQVVRLAAHLKATKINSNTKWTQTDPLPQKTPPTTTTVGSDATVPGIYISTVQMLTATVHAELACVLRMPKSDTSSMIIELTFKAIPYEAMLQVFPSCETHHSPDGAVTTGLIRSMGTLDSTIKMEQNMAHGLGCCKLVLPDTALVGRSILAFAPTFQIWTKVTEFGALETMLSCYLVILDESGELREPPNKT